MNLLSFNYSSDVLGRPADALVLAPPGPGPHTAMFLLHGLWGGYQDWLRKGLADLAFEGHPFLVVMPNGDRSFYADAVEGPAYGRAIGEELPRIVRDLFNVRPEFCITGLSMGGYGALRAALTYSDRFKSAVSLSGALRFGSIPFDVADRDTPEYHRTVGKQPEGGPNDLFAIAERLGKERRPKIRLECGRDDHLLSANRELNQRLTELGYGHEYEESDGFHNWDFWREHLASAIQFHRRAMGL